VTSVPTTRYVVLAYDVIRSISFFGDQMSPYWRRFFVNGLKERAIGEIN
jgi:hypothetical protein